MIRAMKPTIYCLILTGGCAFLSGCGGGDVDGPQVGLSQTPDSPAGRPALTAQTPATAAAKPALPKPARSPFPPSQIQIAKAGTPAPATKSGEKIDGKNGRNSASVVWAPEASGENRTVLRFTALAPNTSYLLTGKAMVDTGAHTQLQLRAKAGAAGEPLEIREANAWLAMSATVNTGDGTELELIAAREALPQKSAHTLHLSDVLLIPTGEPASPAPAAAPAVAEAEEAETPAPTVEQAAAETPGAPEEEAAPETPAPETPAADISGETALAKFFEQWNAGATLPEGAYIVPDAEFSEISSVDDETEQGKKALQQTWKKSDAARIAEVGFGLELRLKPETSYTLTISARSEEEAAAVIGVYGISEAGNAFKLADPCVDDIEVEGTEWKKFQGEFDTGNYETIRILTRASRKKGMKFPQAIQWDNWQLVEKQ